MSSETFLEQLYRGSFDPSFFDAVQTPHTDDRVERLIGEYGKLLEDYPPLSLEREGRIPEAMLKRMSRIGLFGMSIPQEYGGLGLSLGDYLKAIEGMVRLDMSSTLAAIAHLSIGVKGILLFGSEAQKQKYLPPAASGDMIFSYALTEPRIGSDAQHIETRAELSQDGTHYILNGQKTYITNANYAGGLTVFAQLDPKRPGFLGAFIVETGWEGVRIGKDMPKMGLKASSTAAIQFKDVRVPRENLLGAPGEGFKIAMTILNYGRLGLGAASVSMMEQSLVDMAKRASTRIQFGSPIKDFPLVQEKLVRARVNRFVSAAMNDFVIAMLERHPLMNVALETSHCKLFGTTRAWDTLYDALQVAGGSGYLSTQPYEKRMRDFRVATVFEGTTEIHSIYPPLFLLRKMGKESRQAERGTFSQLGFLLGNLVKRTSWPLELNHPVLKRASRLARANADSVRRMLMLGALIYGKRVVHQEFFLRRITTLSLYLFGIVAVLSQLEAHHRRTGHFNEEECRLLGFLVEEAREERRKSRRILSSRKERLSARIAQAIFQV